MTIAEIPNGLNNVGTQNMTGILIKFNQIWFQKVFQCIYIENSIKT